MNLGNPNKSNQTDPSAKMQAKSSEVAGSGIIVL
jgi:hypothetical protein